MYAGSELTPGGTTNSTGEFPVFLRLNEQQKPHRNTECERIKGFRDPSVGIWTLWPTAQRFSALFALMDSVETGPPNLGLYLAGCSF